MIADKFAQVSQEYEKLETEDIKIPYFSENEIPQFSEDEVKTILSQLDANKSIVNGDFPAKFLKTFAGFLAVPMRDLINSSIKQGRWPDICKLEIVTPVPKEQPVKNLDMLRNISGLINLDKVAEKLISKLIISDMKAKLDPSQYANQKGLSIQHYLIKFIDKILAQLLIVIIRSYIFLQSSLVYYTTPLINIVSHIFQYFSKQLVLVLTILIAVY